jgi:hypothetical protein
MDLTLLSLAAVFGLGAFHGVNPGMGWLFAVALGMQEGKGRAVRWALMPLAAGHAVAVVVAVTIAALVGIVVPQGALRWVAGLALVGLGLSRLLHPRHPRWGGMRVGFPGLASWSFLMASAHGAGLMLVPFVLGGSVVEAGVHAHHTGPASTASLGAGLVATAVHSAGYLLVTGALAVLVFEKVGLGQLRRAWINLDVIWAASLVVTGVMTCLL